MVRFESQAKGAINYGDKELHFIVDGKPLKVGECAVTMLRLPGLDPELRPGFKYRELLTNNLSLAQL